MNRRKLTLLALLVITLCLLNACSTTDALDKPQPTVSPEAITAGIAKAEELFKEREDIGKLRNAVEELRKVRDYRNRNFEVEWKYARMNYFLGKQSGNGDDANAAFEAGRDAAKIAFGLEPKRAEGHFWYGANLGELGRLNMLTVGLKAVGEVKDAMQKVIEIQPNYQDHSAYDVLGQVEIETRLYGGDVEKAVGLFEKALETEKNNMNLHLHLGEAYLALKQPEKARKQFEQVLAMKPNPEYLIECKEAVERARKLLATRF